MRDICRVFVDWDSLPGTWQPSILRLNSQLKRAMPGFTPWCHTGVDICLTTPRITSQPCCGHVVTRGCRSNAGASIPELSPASEISQPRPGIIFKADESVNQGGSHTHFWPHTHRSVRSCTSDAAANKTRTWTVRTYREETVFGPLDDVCWQGCCKDFLKEGRNVQFYKFSDFLFPNS